MRGRESGLYRECAMKVSVLLPTFNHIAYIHQALESVLCQKTNFDFEIVIIEDCSTDGTREIVIEYAKRYPDKIRLQLSPVNRFSNINIMNGVETACGEYLAFLEGDDYWISPEKLQKQVDFMDSHPEYVFTWHTVEVVDGDGKWLSTFRNPLSRTARTIEDFLIHYPEPATGSVMIRNSFQIPQWYKSCPVGDYPLWVIALQHGKARFMDEVLAAYRIHAKGAWSGRSEVGRRTLSLECYRSIYNNLHSSYHSVMRGTLAECWWSLALWQRRAGDRKVSRQTAKEGLKECPRNPRLLLMAYTPWMLLPVRTVIRLLRRFKGSSERVVASKESMERSPSPYNS